MRRQLLRSSEGPRASVYRQATPTEFLIGITILHCDSSSIRSNVVVYNTRHSGGLVRLHRVFAGSAQRNTIIRTTEVAIV